MRLVEHSSFLRPSDPSQVLWRYMSLPKLLSLLLSRELYLCQSAALDDPYEGLPSPAIAGAMAHAFQQGDSPLARDEAERRGRGAAQVLARFREMTYVSSWSALTEESDALWRLYAPGESGVAVRSSFGRMEAALGGPSRMSNEEVKPPDHLYLGHVRYGNHALGHQGGDHFNVFDMFVLKRPPYAYEHEVRLLGQAVFEPGSGELTFPKRSPRALLVGVHLEALIDRLVISPYADRWVDDMLAMLLDRLELAIGLERSTLLS